MINHNLSDEFVTAIYVPEIKGEVPIETSPDLKVMISIENQLGLRNLFLVNSIRDLAIQLAQTYTDSTIPYLEATVFHAGFFDVGKGIIYPNDGADIVGTIESIVATVLNSK